MRVHDETSIRREINRGSESSDFVRRRILSPDVSDNMLHPSEMSSRTDLYFPACPKDTQLQTTSVCLMRKFIAGVICWVDMTRFVVWLTIHTLNITQ